jgi:hypothetical protein
MTRLTSYAVAIPLLLCLGSTTPVLAATSSVKCSNGTVTVSTGTSGGTCGKEGTVFTCGKNEANQAGGGCDSEGKASCGNTSGSGSCTIAQHVVHPPKLIIPAVKAGVIKQAVTK